VTTVQQSGRKESINWPPHGCLNPCVYAGLCARELLSLRGELLQLHQKRLAVGPVNFE
jgi:hypothetical protein